jgi:hypothetical protein
MCVCVYVCMCVCMCACVYGISDGEYAGVVDADHVPCVCVCVCVCVLAWGGGGEIIRRSYVSTLGYIRTSAHQDIIHHTCPLKYLGTPLSRTPSPVRRVPGRE